MFLICEIYDIMLSLGQGNESQAEQTVRGVASYAATQSIR